jgi:hypothetical protein
MSFHSTRTTRTARTWIGLDRAVVAALTKPTGGTFNTVVFQDIRHVNTVDSYSEEYQLHAKVSSFEAMVNEDQAT